MMNRTATSRITELAAAGGNCSAPIWVLITLPTEAICWPPITPTVTKSPITMVMTKIEPMTIPGFDRGMTMFTSVCHPVAPAS